MTTQIQKEGDPPEPPGKTYQTNTKSEQKLYDTASATMADSFPLIPHLFDRLQQNSETSRETKTTELYRELISEPILFWY